jgi:hypothetical protein
MYVTSHSHRRDQLQLYSTCAFLPFVKNFQSRSATSWHLPTRTIWFVRRPYTICSLQVGTFARNIPFYSYQFISFGRGPIEKTSENRSFLTLTRNFSTKIQNWAKMDGTIGFALLFCVGTNYRFLFSNRLLSRHHAFKGGGWDEWFSLILRPPQPYQISTGPNAFRERKKNEGGKEKTRMSHLSWKKIETLVVWHVWNRT